METTLTSICLGIGLSAACGFRVFVPLLFMSLASLSGHLTLAPGFAWIGTYPALIAFSIATAIEIAGYYIPWVDHALDTIATPAAIVAGIVATAAIVTNTSPLLKWSLAIIAGGGVAAMIQGGSILARTTSTATTVGIANPVVATMELGGSVLTSLLAFIMPVLLVCLVIVLCAFVGFKLLRRQKHPRTLQTEIA